jgi:tRNA pseudouridine38-40 synthase
LRYFIELSFKGTNYFGWQIQPDAPTVQEKLNFSLSLLLREKIEIVGAGRTDSGVHAKLMVAHFDSDGIESPENLTHRLNSLLPDDIAVYRVYEVQRDAHARFDAESRSYIYKIYLGRDPFELETTWQIHNRDFDIERMNEACKVLLKHKDFKAFSKSKTDVKTYECVIFDAEWVLDKSKLNFNISANRFLRNMVRAIVGTMLEVGRGDLSIADFENVILSKNRSNAGKSVPARGLYLSNIKYPDNKIYGKQNK